MLEEDRNGATLLRCRWLLRGAYDAAEDGAVILQRGRVVEVATGGAAARLVRAATVPVVDVPGLLAPGLVDAHAHVELSALHGRVPSKGGFVPWIAALIRERDATPRADLIAAAQRGAAALARSGVTTVGDIDSLGWIEGALVDSPLRWVFLREVLDGGRSARAARVLAALDAFLAEAQRVAESRTSVGGSPGGLRLRGLSPHAPHTVSATLMRALGARRAGNAVQVHWAETTEEVQFLASGGGPFERLLGSASHFQRLLGPRRPTTGLARLASAGLLEGVSLVHGNHPGPAEPTQIAAAGASVVHCPGTHRFFGREPFPWRVYQEAGVTLALGTDSLASNDELDMLRELTLARSAMPEVDPREFVAAATRGGALALGLGGRPRRPLEAPALGRIDPGAVADLVEFEAHPRDGGTLPGAPHRDPARCALHFADLLTSGALRARRSWVEGASAYDASPAP